MLKLSYHYQDRQWNWNDTFHDLSIPLNPDGPQPNLFDAEPASRAPMRVPDFVGSVAEGGSCNANVLSINPHCNGTHTEGIGHVVSDNVSVLDAAPRKPVPALLVSIEPQKAAAAMDKLSSPWSISDLVISGKQFGGFEDVIARLGAQALIVRTRPNSVEKKRKAYNQASHAPYFTVDAINWMIKNGISHLVCDLPSIDRIHDDGKLLAHRRFWGLPEGSRDIGQADRAGATITEMAYIDDKVRDGVYLLSLHLAPIVSDGVPSRPMLYGLDAQ